MKRQVTLHGSITSLQAEPKIGSALSSIEELVLQLESEYGTPDWEPRMDPVSELVCCILSQNTADTNSMPAFHSLIEKYRTWDEVVSEDPTQLATVIRRAGLVNQKASSIQSSLRIIKERNGGYTLENLREMSIEAAREWLTSLPGIGPKTASIVLCFAMGRGIVPVDTHVFRVGWRIGLYEKRIGAAKAHDVLVGLVPEFLAYRYHVALIQHGRSVCKAQKRLCGECILKHKCKFQLNNSDQKPTLKNEHKKR